MALRKSAFSSSKLTASPMSQPLELTSKIFHPPYSPSFSQPSPSGKDLQDLMSETIKQMTEMFQEMVSKMQIRFDQIIQQQQELLQKHERFCTNVTTAFQTLAEYVDVVAERVEENEQRAEASDYRLKFVEESLENLKGDVLTAQFRDMEFAIRIRGLAEDPKENLRQVIAEALMDALACGQEIYLELERVFRVNSWVARQKNWPRDVVVYFTRKSRRNEITQLFYQQRFKILNQDITLLKEIPVKILKAWRDYAFLTQELKNRQITFRWDIPVGIIVTVDGKSYRINSIEKANDFMASVLQVECPPISQKTDAADQLMVDFPSASGVKDVEGSLKLDGKEQRVRTKTRAARRRKQRGRQLTARSTADSITTDCLSLVTSEPLGGA